MTTSDQDRYMAIIKEFGLGGGYENCVRAAIPREDFLFAASIHWQVRGWPLLMLDKDGERVTVC